MVGGYQKLYIDAPLTFEAGENEYTINGIYEKIKKIRANKPVLVEFKKNIDILNILPIFITGAKIKNGEDDALIFEFTLNIGEGKFNYVVDIETGDAVTIITTVVS